MSTAKQSALASLRFARTINDKLVSDFPPAKATFQPAPTDNHLVWNLGHLAISNAWIRGLIDGKKADLPESYNDLFGGKSKPTSDPKAYPSFAEVKKHNDVQFKELVAAIEKLPDADINSPCTSDTGGFAKTKLEAIERAAWHEGWHGGQISSLRRALGLPPAMG